MNAKSNTLIIYGIIVAIILCMIYFQNIEVSLISNGIILLILVLMIKKNKLELMTPVGMNSEAIQNIASVYNNNSLVVDNLQINKLNAQQVPNLQINGNITGNVGSFQSNTINTGTIPIIQTNTISTNNAEPTTANISNNTTIGGTLSVAKEGKINNLIFDKNIIWSDNGNNITLAPTGTLAYFNTKQLEYLINTQEIIKSGETISIPVI